MADANSIDCTPSYAENLPRRLQWFARTLDKEVTNAIDERDARNRMRLSERSRDDLILMLSASQTSNWFPESVQRHSMLMGLCLSDTLHMIHCRLSMLAGAVPLTEDSDHLSLPASEGIVQSLREIEDTVLALMLWAQRCSQAYRQAEGVSPEDLKLL
jgi:hypothetical protein